MAAAPVARMLDLLAEVLATEEPANVDRESVTVTSYGYGEMIVLVPHRDLGGYSLGLTVSIEQMQMVWATSVDLEYRDDIDMGTWVSAVHGSAWADDDAVKSAIRSELLRPIRVRVERTRIFRRRWLRCAIENTGKWIETPVCHVATDVPESITSLMGPERPDLRCVVPIHRWRRFADPAWPSP